MKLSTLFALSMLTMISGNALAQKKPELPNVQAPRELVDIGSEYAEGTISRLSADDVSQFIPWAQNAQSVLTKALRDIETMTIDQQVRHLTAIIKSVVRNSGQKSYQLFMRFALNRTLLLVQELTFQSDWETPGTAENVLDLQVKGINLALTFYESDLAYQRRANQGNETVNLEYGKFGAIFGKTMFLSIQNILDASAQYRLLYKTLEMINWDFSRDAMAIDFSDTIVEIYNTLNSMNEIPTNADFDNVLAIRRLNILLQPIQEVERAILVRNEATRRQVEERERLERYEATRREMERMLSSGIAVLAENTFFIISGNEFEDRYNSCLRSYPSGKVDQIQFSFGNRDLKYLFNSADYWDRYQGCQKILGLLDSVPTLSTQSYNVYGTIEKTTFNFSGPTVASLLYQCHAARQSVSENVDEIMIGVNNQAPVLLYNSADYWKTAFTLCQALLNKAIRIGN